MTVTVNRREMGGRAGTTWALMEGSLREGTHRWRSGQMSCLVQALRLFEFWPVNILQ